MNVYFRMLVAPLLGMTLAVVDAQAQTWPTRPLRVIAPITPGGLPDVVPRLVFEQLSTQLQQSIIVENRPGAGQTIGTALVAKAQPDGYTLLVTTSGHTIAPALHTSVTYHPARDFAAVIPLGASPFVLVVSPSRGYKSPGDLIAAAKAKPGTFNFASAGVGTASHLSSERFRLSTGVQAVHVPFKGGIEAMTEVIGGRVDFFFQALGVAVPHVRDGRLAALAINTAKRSALLPDVRTLQEAGISNADYPTWIGVLAPVRTPRTIVDKLHRETLKALDEPHVRSKLATMGIEAMVMTPKEFDAYIGNTVTADAALVRALGLKAE